MRRILFHIASILSLLLLIACAILWPRSHFAQDDYYFPPIADHALIGSENDPAYRISLSSTQGNFQVMRSQPYWEKLRPSGHASSAPGKIFSLTPDRPVDTHFQFAGIEYFNRPRHTYKEGDSTFTLWAFRYLTLPYWLLTTLFAILPILWTLHLHRQFRARSRLKRGLCPACGYDLRSSKNRCPECGQLTPVPETVPSPD